MEIIPMPMPKMVCSGKKQLTSKLCLPMIGDSIKCMAMYGRCAATGLVNIPRKSKLIHRALIRVRLALYVEVAGSHVPAACAPPIVAAGNLKNTAVLPAFVLLKVGLGTIK